MTTTDSLTIRRAGDDDALTLLQLADLDSTDALTGDVLIAEVGGEAWAAIELSTGRVAADPFRPSAEVAELLRLRAERLNATPAPGGRRSLLRRYATRWGYSASTSSR